MILIHITWKNKSKNINNLIIIVIYLYFKLLIIYYCFVKWNKKLKYYNSKKHSLELGIRFPSMDKWFYFNKNNKVINYKNKITCLLVKIKKSNYFEAINNNSNNFLT